MKKTAQWSKPQWSSRSLGSRFQHDIFRWLLRCRAMFLARGLLRAVVFYYTLLPHVRRRCSFYLERRFGRSGPVRNFWRAHRLYLSFGRVLLERMTSSVTGRLSLVEMSDMRTVLADALRRGKGCLVVSAHVGAWQVGLGALGTAGVPVHVLQWRDPGDVDRHYFENDQKSPVSVIDAARPVEALVEATAALRQGHVVALMGDRRQARNPAQSQSEAAKEHVVETDFLGGQVLLPVTPYALASITGAPLLMVFTVLDNDRIRPAAGGEIHVPPGLNHRDPTAFTPYARQFAQGLEDFVARHPYQFFNFYNLWQEKHGSTDNPHES